MPFAPAELQRFLQPQPLAGALALPAEFYVDPAWSGHERSTVFARSWQLFGHISQVAATGDHLVGEIAGVPLLVVRGEDGQLRAFHNVCRHRAGPLASCSGRGARALRCRYHGWTYTLEGQLRSATEMPASATFDPAGVRLPQARVEVWQGLVFVRLDQPGVSLAETTAGIAERMGGRGFESDQLHSRVSYDIACNWKVYVDNYLEGYHLPHVHPTLNQLLDYREYRTETSRLHSLQYSPLDGAGPYDAGAAWYWFIYPNTMLNVLPGRLQTNRVIPLTAHSCRVEFDFYYSHLLDDRQRGELAKADLAFSDQVQVEDIGICEQVQRGLASGSYRSGPLNPLRETALWHFHELLRHAWRQTP